MALLSLNKKEAIMKKKHRELLEKACAEQVFERVKNDKRDLLEFIEEVMAEKTTIELIGLKEFK